MIQCPKCGSSVADGTRFCGKCGNQIPLASAATKTSATETVVAPEIMGAAAPTRKSFDFKKLLIPGGIVLLALLLVLLVPKLFSGGGAGSLKKDHVFVGQPNSDQWFGISKSGKAIIEDDAERISGSTTSADGSCCAFLTSGNDLYIFDGKKYTKVDEDVKKYMLSFDGKSIAYLNYDDELHLYSGGKSKEVAEDVSSLTAISPDGKAVGYTKFKNDTHRGYYYNGKEIDLGKEISPRAFSNGGRLVYFTNSDGKMFVQSGDNSESKQRLLNSVGSFILNQDGTQFMGYDDDGGKTWFSDNGKERQEVGKETYSPLVSISGVSGGGYIGWSSLKNHLFTKDNTVYKMNDKLEMSSITKYNLRLYLLDDGKTISYIRNNKLYICNTAAGNPEPKELAEDVDNYIPSRNGKLFLYESEDGETYTVTSGGKSQRILNDTVDDWAWAGDGGFLYLRDDALYFTNGGKASKASGIKEDVSAISDLDQYVLISADEGDVIYFTNNGKNFTKIWEEK